MTQNPLNPNDLRTYPVQPKPCKTCPYEGEKPVQLSPDRYYYFINNLAGNGQHLCHSLNNQAICRGGRNIQLRMLCAMGLLDEPTDEAFNQALNQALNQAESV
jgi:hypothetical protein